MTYEELEALRNKMTEEDAEAAEDMASALEQVLEENSFRRMPRSVRTAGLGFGCMEIFRHGGVYTVVRNNGSGLDKLPAYGSAEKCFVSLVSAIYGVSKPKGFAKEQYERFFCE